MALPARCWGASGAAVRRSLALLACAATLLPAAAADPAAPGRRAALELRPAAGAARLSAGDGAPAWRGRLDYYFKKQYFAPAIFQSDPCGRPYAPNCTALPGRRYPYEEIIVDPTGATDRPVLRATYPEGSGTFGSQVRTGSGCQKAHSRSRGAARSPCPRPTWPPRPFADARRDDLLRLPHEERRDRRGADGQLVFALRRRARVLGLLPRRL